MAARRAELPGHFDQHHTVLIGGGMYKSKVGLNFSRPNVGSAFIINQKLAGAHRTPLKEVLGTSCTEAAEWCPSVCARRTNRGSGLGVMLLM